MRKESAPQDSRRFKKTRTGLASAVIALGTLAHPSTPARAEGGPVITTVDTSADGVPGINPSAPSASYDSSSVLGTAFRTKATGSGSDIRFKRGTSEAVFIDSTAPGGRTLSLVTPPEGKPVVFYDTSKSTNAAVCMDAPVCSDWKLLGNWSVQGGANSFEAKVAPDGTIGVAYSVSHNGTKELWYKRFVNRDLSVENAFNAVENNFIKKSLVTSANKVGLTYDTITGNPRVVWTNDRDAMVAVSPNSNFDRGSDEAPTPAVITALDAQSESNAFNNIAVVNTPDGLRATYQARQVNEQGATEYVTRVGSCVEDDENCDTSGAQSSTVDNASQNGIGTDVEALSDNRVQILTGSDTGLRQVVCPADFNNCNSSNYVDTLDASGPTRDPSFDIAPDGSAGGAYIAGDELKILTGPTETFGVDTTQQSQQQPANNESGAARRGAPDEDPTALPEVPVGTKYQVASDPRYIVGKKVVDACLATTNNRATCDLIWHR